MDDGGAVLGRRLLPGRVPDRGVCPHAADPPARPHRRRLGVYNGIAIIVGGAAGTLLVGKVAEANGDYNRGFMVVAVVGMPTPPSSRCLLDEPATG